MREVIFCIDAGDTKAWSRAGKRNWEEKKKKKAGERRSHMTVLELRYGPDGKLERSLETGGGTGLPTPSDA